jgi:uncharacterized membrane protein YphA (DoxX/SURF4 family)
VFRATDHFAAKNLNGATSWQWERIRRDDVETLMEQLAGWIAPAAVMIAAIMTAANLGTRVTGWGFVIFTIGAVAWSAEAWFTHQPNLLWSNGFLAIVDGIGIYRWLGRRAKLEDGAHAAVRKSRNTARPLFPVLSLEGLPIEGTDGTIVGHAVGAMAECESGQIAYLVIRRSGEVLDQQLHAVAWSDIQAGEVFRTSISREQLAGIPAIKPEDWPSAKPSGMTPL